MKRLVCWISHYCDCWTVRISWNWWPFYIHNFAKSLAFFQDKMCQTKRLFPTFAMRIVWDVPLNLTHSLFSHYLLEQTNFETSQFSCAQCAFKVINKIVCIAISYRFRWLIGHNVFVGANVFFCCFFLFLFFLNNSFANCVWQRKNGHLCILK